ncbi:hypothetical protein [Spirosoma migulaei]
MDFAAVKYKKIRVFKKKSEEVFPAIPKARLTEQSQLKAKLSATIPPLYENAYNNDPIFGEKSTQTPCYPVVYVDW